MRAKIVSIDHHDRYADWAELQNWSPRPSKELNFSVLWATLAGAICWLVIGYGFWWLAIEGHKYVNAVTGWIIWVYLH